MAGPLDTRTTAQIEADNRDYLKKVKQIEEADKRAADKRDVALIKSLKEQGKLTEEAFRTAKAQEQVAKTQEQGLSSLRKGIDLVGGKIKEFGQGLIGGLVGGLGDAVLGGSLQGIVAEAFAPPTDEDLRQWSRLSEDFVVLGNNVRDLAQAEIERRASAENRKKGTSDAEAAVEAVTHANSLEQLMRAMGEVTIIARESRKAHGENGITVEQEDAAIEKLREDYAKLTGELTTQQAAVKATTEARVRLIQANTEEFLDTIKHNGQLIADAKKYADENKALGKSIDGLRASLDPLVAEQQKLDATYELLEKSRRRGLISLEEEARLNTEVAESLYEIRRAAMEAEKARRAEIADLTGEGPITRAGRLIDADRPDLVDRSGGSGAQARAAQILKDREQLSKQQEQLAGMFGESSPFKGIDLVTKGFDALSQSAAAAFDALISGSESAGAAFAKALGGMLRADSVQAGIQALKEGAWALGSLAFGDAKGAALHAASAAQWAVTAAAAGAGAALLGAAGGGGSTTGGGSGAGASSSGGGYYGSGAGGDPNRGTEQIIVAPIGDSHGSSSPRFEAVKARRYASLAGASNDRPRYE